ncbi:hypothetical protein Ait01nite_015540 [Actinoplanes italicus]|uniref:Uncharacterized protein n=1 Tax=Actinoplanes italicus TaxID=113567 RepID=A0A2T0KIB4_9ACTN|nr:hypothetical protein CLV67_104515 [Actinoplanes italicus]GIE28509.1 hypothetical protein Ait01nite_015540 [Actinoplanes italicus]
MAACVPVYGDAMGGDSIAADTRDRLAAGRNRKTDRREINSGTAAGPAADGLMARQLTDE